MKTLFVVNPIAGKGKGLAFIKAFEPMIKEKTEYELVLTKCKNDATEIVRRYTAKEDYIVFAVGGDGTVNEVLNGLMGSKSKLAIIPTGSGNDLVRSIYPQISNEALLLGLLEGNSERIDVIKVEERYFLNIASVGFDADVVYNAAEYKKSKYIKGDTAYLLSLFKTLFGHRGTSLQVLLDDKEVCNEKVLLLAVANGRYYGGGIPITPNACLTDEVADICLIRELRLLKILKVLPKLFKATHIESKSVEIYHSKNIIIKSPDGCRLNIDGEITTAYEIRMQVIPRSLEIIIPNTTVV